MVSLKNYKIIIYSLLVVVVIVTFLLTNLLLNLIIADKLSKGAIIFVILNLFLNFTMFFLFFRVAQQLIEKEATLNEILHQIQASREVEERKEEVIEQKEFNVDELVQQIVPQSPQNLTLEKFGDKVLANIAKVSGLVIGIMYVKDKTSGVFSISGKYSYYSNEKTKTFFEGETLPGQVAKDKKIINLSNVPEDYFTVVSGLGKSSPGSLLIVPIIEKDETIAILELGSFTPYDKDFEKLLEKLALMLGKIIVKIK